METITYRARIASAQIGFLNSIIESYEGIGVVRTLHAHSGIIELWLPPEFEALVLEVMCDVASDVGLLYLYKAQHRLSA